MNDYQIYVINLEKDVEKLAHFYKQVNDKFTYKKITGIEPKQGNIFLNKGQLGCLRSHRVILEDAIKNNYKKILIFEDDVIFKDTWENIQKKINRFLRAKPHLLYMGCSQHKWENIRLRQFRKKRPIIQDIHIKNGFYNPLYSFGSFAILIDSSIFYILLRKYVQEHKPIDNYLVEYQHSHRNRCIVMYPNSVIADVSSSNTGAPRDMTTMMKIFRWDKA